MPTFLAYAAVFLETNGLRLVGPVTGRVGLTGDPSALVVEFAQRLDASYKIRNGTGKWLHRRVCERFLDPHILKRKKRGFAVNVVDGWFRSSLQGKLPEMLLDENSLMFQLLEPKAVRRLLQDHRSGRQDNYKLLFSLLMFEQWMRGNRSDHEQFAHIPLNQSGKCPLLGKVRMSGSIYSERLQRSNTIGQLDLD